MNRKFTPKLIVTISFLFLLAACSSSTENVKYEGDLEMTATVKVMTNVTRDSFMEEEGDLFNTKYPNINIEIVNYPPGDFEQVIKESKPDIFILSLEEYKQFVQEGRLYDLDVLFANNDFNLEGIHPDIVDYLRQLGNGKLYGVLPQFSSMAIYYNKDLFDKYGVPYPQDQMTWGELLQLSKRFPAEDGIHGLYLENISTLVDNIARSKHINEINTKDMKVTLNTKSYKEVFEMALDAFNSKAVVLPDTDPFEVYDPFITGKSAMTVDYYYYINNKINWAKAEQGGNFHLNWDLVSAPVDESDRDTSPYFSVGGIYSLNAESEGKQAAWELIKFINSEELAKVKSKTAKFSMPTRTDYIMNPDGKRMEAFYILKPDVNSKSTDYRLLPQGTSSNLKGIINSELKAVTAGAKTLDEAMASMEERGQRLLDKK